MFYNFSCFAKPSMDFIQLWRDNRALAEILCTTIPIPVHDLKNKVTDFKFFCVNSLQCQLLQSLWLIWIVFGMNGYKILKCFRKEKRISGELPCPVTGLIILAGNEDMHKISDKFDFQPDWTTDYGVSCPWACKKFPMGICCLYTSSFIFDRIVIKVAGK